MLIIIFDLLRQSEQAWLKIIEETASRAKLNCRAKSLPLAVSSPAELRLQFNVVNVLALFHDPAIKKNYAFRR
jgi:hypothetical protein